MSGKKSSFVKIVKTAFILTQLHFTAFSAVMSQRPPEVTSWKNYKTFGHNESTSCSLLPFQAKDSIENAALSVSTLQDEHAAQDVEVQLIFWD